MTMSPGMIIQPPKNEDELKEIINLVQKISNIDKLVMVKADGQSVEIPNMVSKVLYEIITILSKGGSMTIIPMDKELTTQQAADILNVSRPYFIKLLDANLIPFHKTGSHRKVLMRDLIEYKNKITENRSSKIAELIDITQEIGLYD